MKTLFFVSCLIASLALSLAFVDPSEVNCDDFKKIDEVTAEVLRTQYPELYQAILKKCLKESILKLNVDSLFANDEGDNSTDSSPVDFQVDQNANQHHTEDYAPLIGKNYALVVRRGQTFVVKVDSSEDSPKFFLGSQELEVASTQEGVVTLKIPVSSPVGVFDFKLNDAVAGQVAVLFNPWSSEDSVFLDDEDARQEYVLGRNGRIWFGDVLNSDLAGAGSMSWTYDQFEVFPTVMQIFEQIPEKFRADVRQISRHLTWLLNDASYENGLVEGNWGSDFSAGTEPTAWTGSLKIYEEWVSRGQKPALYGQCWVFGGTLTSALRGLGVPSRPITNFRSAHDSQPYDKVIEQKKGESIWNFHVWVDAWMVHENEIGWNAVDSTPQEQSDGLTQMGPAFVKSVRENIDEDFDTPFVIGEVSARVWLGDKDFDPNDSNPNPDDFDVEDVGRFMSTKKIGCVTDSDEHQCREDITLQYKKSGAHHGLRGVHPRSVHDFSGTILPARPQAGQPFTIFVRRGPVLTLKKPTSISISILVEATTYSGRVAGVIRRQRKISLLTPVSSSELFNNLAELVVNPSDYSAFLNYAMGVRVTVHISGYGDRDYYFRRQFQLTNPKMTVELIDDDEVINAGEKFEAVVTFSNPLNVPLKNSKLHVNLPNKQYSVKIGDIPARGQFYKVIKDIVADRPGHNVVAFSLQNDQLRFVTGSQEVIVDP